MRDREPVIGIDLGTTNSVVATVQGHAPQVIKNRTGQGLTPSVVAVTKAGKRLVGHIAKRQAITNPEATVYAAKRLIGRKFSSLQVQSALKVLAYPVLSGEHDDVRLRMGDKDVSLPEVSAMVLRELKLDAEAYFGKPVTKAVITVPAYFNDGQRQATKDAGKIAGLEVLRIINEPTAAALAYGAGRSVGGKIAVFDLGGGTFDISVLEVGNGVFDVIATGGDSYLGGEDFDNRIIDWLVLGFAKEHGIDLRKDRMALQRLKDCAEKAKIELSSVAQTHVNLPFVCTPPGGGTALHLQKSLTRAQLEEMTQDLIERTLRMSEKVLGEAGVRPGDLKEVVLVGGMTRMPKVVEAVKTYFRREPSKGVHPEEVVALGAALHANTLASGDASVTLLDVTPQSLGVAVAGGFVRRLIPKNTTVPTSTTEVFGTSKDHQGTVKILVLQGESDIAYENELLGEFILTGLRQALRGEVEIEVTFDINSEGIVSVSAVDKDTGAQQSIRVTASGGLTEDELRRIMDEQGDHLLEARTSEELKAKRAELDALILEVDVLLPKVRALAAGSDFGMEAAVRAERAVDAARKARSGGTLAQVTEACDQVGRAVAVFKGFMQRVGGV